MPNPNERDVRQSSKDVAPFALSLAVALDKSRRGLTKQEIRALDAAADPDMSEAAFKKRLQRARDYLAKMGLVVTCERKGNSSLYKLASDLSFAQTNSIGLSSEETARLVALILAGMGSMGQFENDLRGAFRRILSMAGSLTEMPAELGRLASEPVAADAGGKDGDQGKVLAIVLEAQDRRLPLSFDYEDAKGAIARRCVEVYTFWAAAGHRYFVGRDRAKDALRTFRLDRVRPGGDSPVLEEKLGAFEIPPDFDPSDFFRLPFQYEPFASAASPSAPATAPGADGGMTLVFEELRPLSDQERATISRGQGTWSQEGGGPCIWRVGACNDRVAASWALKRLAAGELRLVGPKAVVDLMRDGLRKEVADRG